MMFGKLKGFLDKVGEWLDEGDETAVKSQSSLQPETEPMKWQAEWFYPIFRIHSPVSDKFSSTAAIGLIRALKARSKGFGLTLSMVGTPEGVHWEIYIADFEHLTEVELTELLNTYYPGAVAEQVTMQEPAQPLYRCYHVFKPQAVRYFDRALSANDIRSDDPLVGVAKALAELEAGESIRYNLSVVAFDTTSEEEKERVLTVSAWDAGYRPTGGAVSTRSVEAAIGSALGGMVGRGIAGIALRNQRVQAYSDADTLRFLEKLNQELMHCIMSVTYDSPNPARLQSIQRLYGSFQALSSDEVSVVPSYTSPVFPIQNFDDWFEKTHDRFIDKLAELSETQPEEANQYLFVLTDDEVAGAWHPPHAGFPVDILDMRGTHVPAPRNLQPDTQGVKMGVNKVGSRTRDIYLSQGDRTSHMSISGKTGVGKSSLLHAMIAQDIANGLGVWVFDPKGDLVRHILQHSIPEEREDDLLILDLNMRVGDVFYPPPLNLFVSGIADDQQAEASQRLTSAFSRVNKDFAEKKMASTLQQALMAVSYQKNPTINDVYCLLFDEDYRQRLLPLIKNDIVRAYWHKFDLRQAKQQANITEPLEWRLEQLMLNSRLRAMTCHPQRLNFAKLISANKIVLISLGNDTNTYQQDEIDLIGAALLMQLDYAARQNSVTKRPFMVYVDEAQQFVDTSLPNMLSQLRSYGIGMVLANQYLSQLFGGTAAAVEGNVGTIMSFEVGKSDARSVLPYFEPQFTDNALVSLGKYTSAISMRDDEGRRLPAFTVQTLPPPGFGNSNPDREAYLRKRVVERWGFTPYDEVLSLIQQRYAQCGQADIPLTETNNTDSVLGSGHESNDDFWR